MVYSLFSGSPARILFILLCLFHLKFGVLAGWNKIVSDFPNYYVSSKVISASGDASVLYNDSLFNRELNRNGIFVQGQFSLYPPATAFIMLPLIKLSPRAAKNIWMLFNVFLLFACILMISQVLAINFFFAGNIMLLPGFCLTNDLMLGQVYLFMLTLTIYGYFLIQKNNMIAGSFLWGLVMALKYYTILLLPVYFFRKKGNIVTWVLISFSVVCLCSLYLVGLPVFTYFIRNILAGHLEGKITGQTAFSVQFQSFESLFNRLFTRDATWNPHPFYESEHLFFIFKTVSYAVPLAFAVHLVVKARHLECREELSSAVLITLLLLLEPGSASYHLLLLVYPVLMAVRVLMKRSMRGQIARLLGCMTGIGFLSVLLNRISLRFELPLLFQYNRLWLLLLFYGVLLSGFYACINEKNKSAGQPLSSNC